MPNLHPVSLHFTDAPLERDYQAKHAGWVPGSARLALLLATALITAFGFVDPLVMPEHVDILRSHRLMVVTVFSLMLAFTFHPLFKRHNQVAAWLTGFAGGYAVVMLPALISLEHGYTYYVGVVLAPAFFFNLLGLRFLQALTLTALLVLAYNLVVLAKGIPYPMLVNNNLFVFGISIVTAASGYVNEMQQRTVFYQSHLMQKLKEKADEANEAKSRFFANMSHELRTPLNAIIGYGEMLLEDARKSGNEELGADLSAIDSASHHLLELINDVLDLAKIDAGKFKLNNDDIDVTAFLKRTLTTATPLAIRNNNQLVFDSTLAPTVLRADSLRLQQILNNLISNACKFTENGTISVNVYERGNEVVFAIDDTGIGMTPEQVEHLFDEYQQVHSVADKHYGGTGLGLAISQRLARLMGGDISVSSAARMGTSFVLNLPLARS